LAQVWIVRAGPNDEYEQVDLQQGIVALGWRSVGDLTKRQSLTEINAVVDVAYAADSIRSRRTSGVQLFAFRSKMHPGHWVILLRGNAPDVAIGTVTGDYAYRPDLPACHVRPVRWARVDVRRTVVGADLLTTPALSNIYRVGRADAARRIEAISAGSHDGVAIAVHPGRVADQVGVGPGTRPIKPVDNLRRNLEYALSLATAGLHLQKLKVEAFEVSDVFRAAWVQAVAALDHWVHQELRERMVNLAENPPAELPAQFQKFQLPISAVDDIVAKRVSFRDAVEQQWTRNFGGSTFQNPDKIRAGFANVADVSQLWHRVAGVLSERAADGVSYTSNQVEQRLKEVVLRRNKIAHEYDEDPLNEPQKRAIDAASTTQAIEFIGRMAEAIIVVLDQPKPSAVPASAEH